MKQQTENEMTEPAKKEKKVSVLLHDAHADALELAEGLASVKEALRTAEADWQSLNDSVIAILQQHCGTRDDVKRAWPHIGMSDREKLKRFGFSEPRKEKL